MRVVAGSGKTFPRGLYRYNLKRGDSPVTLLRAVTAASVSVVILLSACGVGDDPPETQAAPAVKADSDRKPAPEFALKDADGRSVTLADYKGKVVLLNFWATWCGPCKIEIPWFVDFEQKYKDRGFAVLGVAMDEEGWEVVKPYIAKNKVNYRILMGNDSTAQMYGGVESLPTTFVIDAGGRIASTHVGLVSKSEYENEIVELLNSAKRTDSRAAGTTVARANQP
jgi:cytochrome c biogenesis protein CcmG/thiol:disulfide interchange protein DsbE